jgi:type II secretory pathway pseudopilin PulG
MLIVCVILGILAGMMLLVFGGSSDKTRAMKIASDLESVKQAALMYESRHKTRNNDPFSDPSDLKGEANSAAFNSAIGEFLDSPLPADYKPTLEYVESDGIKTLRVGFWNLPVDANLAAALDNFVERNKGEGYGGQRNGLKYTLTLRFK